MTGLIHISVGGPTHKISVGGKVITFEMHPYCGPSKLKANGDPADHQPHDFLVAASLWAQQGQKVGADGLCVYEHEREPILQRLGPRSAKVIGWHPAKRGE